MKALRRDFQTDKNQDRKNRGPRHDQIDIGKITQHSGPAHKQRRGQRVSSPTAHGLVGRMPDVRCGLNHASAQAGHHGGQPLHSDDLSRVVLVARRRGAFGAIDSAHHRGQSKRQHDGKINQRLRHRADPFQPWPRHHQRKPRLQIRLCHAGPQRAAPQHGVIHQAAGHQCRQRARPTPRRGNAGRQRRQNHGQRYPTHHRVSSDVEHRQKADQHQSNRRQRAQQTGPRHHAPHPTSEKSTKQLKYPADHNSAHAHVPCVSGRLLNRLGPQPLQGGQETRPDDEQHHGKRARRIEPQRHRSHVAAACPPRQSKSHPGVQHITDQHPQRGARHHVTQSKTCRKIERRGQQPHRQNQIGDIV